MPAKQQNSFTETWTVSIVFHNHLEIDIPEEQVQITLIELQVHIHFGD